MGTHFLAGAQKWRVRHAKQMIATFEPQGPTRLTDVTRDETFISFYGMPSTQANMVWIDEAGDRPGFLRPGFQSKKPVFTIFFNHPGPQVVDICRRRQQWPSATTQKKVLPKVVAAVRELRPSV